MQGWRAASPLAAVAVCGGGRVPGRDESLPYELNRKRDIAVSCGPGMPGPYASTLFYHAITAHVPGTVKTVPYGCGKVAAEF